MGQDREYLDGLARLHLTDDAEERRGLWRQSMATLAAEAAEQRPVPLEGLDPADVLGGVRVAIATGLIDDLGFLDASHSAAALYELASVLPLGEERRQLGRRVARRLHQGPAATFVSLATQLAMGSRRALSGAAVRARVALSLDLPIGSGTRADALALALTSRHELAQEWLVAPSSGALPSRRLAARLLERAAREAARRSALGDDSVLSVFDRPGVRGAWDRLLADRESLVWRHVAAARGLLSGAAARYADEITSQLAEDLSPTEWRRAAASLTASIAVAPGTSKKRALAILDGPLIKKDRGIASAMLLGLPRAAEVEPEAADELCTALVRAGGIDAAEALLSLRYEKVGGDFGAWASQMARAKLREDGFLDSADEGLAALARCLDNELCPDEERFGPPTLRRQLEDALGAFAQEGARSAYETALQVLGRVEETLARLEAAPQGTAEGRREAFEALRELDGALLETSALSDLLTLGSRSDDSTATAPLNGFFSRLTDWLLRHEREPVADAANIGNRVLRIHRARTLLHAVDADGVWGEGLQDDLRDRRLRTVRVLLNRVREDAPSPLRRVITASAARACDALLREEIGEVSDVFLTVVQHLDTVVGMTTMAEASMVPEMVQVYRAYAALVERTERSARATRTRARASLDGLRGLISSFPAATSPRVDALHGALLAYSNAIGQVMAAGSLSELIGDEGGGSRVSNLERATRLLTRLVVGARRRLGERPEDAVGVAGPALRLVDIAVERAYRGDKEALGEALASALDSLHEDLPASLAEVCANALVRSMGLPNDPDPTSERKPSFIPPAPKESPLPPWLPPSRTLGGFYVLRALGSGAVGSVFVARRSEEKTREDAPRFALKVPEYTGAAARTLSESEFLRLFREEAGALLAIPEHDNLARLVTFDAGAHPKPILVMELVEGPTLERSIETGTLDIAQAFDLLTGIASGLSAMHAVGVGHLDVKPSNVILRDLDPLAEGSLNPVLVDFGLAGRKVRPGCATANYGAPEVWGLLPKGHTPSPPATDVYAFGCLAFEVLTGRELIHGTSEVAIITSHLSHNGDMDGLRWLAQDARYAPITEVLAGALQQDPRRRTPIAELHDQLVELKDTVLDRPWPLDIAVQASA